MTLAVVHSKWRDITQPHLLISITENFDHTEEVDFFGSIGSRSVYTTRHISTKSSVKASILVDRAILAVRGLRSLACRGGQL